MFLNGDQDGGIPEFTADGAVSTSHLRVAEQWQVPPDAYWNRAWVEVDGSNGGDSIIWRTDNAGLSVSPSCEGYR